MGIEWLPKGFKCGKTWAKNLRFQMAPRDDKFLPIKLRPFTAWLKKQFDEDGNVSNGEAKGKYTELFGAPKSQKASSRFSSRMRKRFGLHSVKAKNGSSGKWEYFWSLEEEE